jgi:hypothetical protein
MQKIKRKVDDNALSPPNKKQKSQNEEGHNIGKKEKINKNAKGVKGKDHKFKKPGNVKGKPNYSKDAKFSKDKNNGEKPKWSEMKQEKKQLRLARRKAKATAEVFEVSHKAKLLAAQIQR